MLLSFFVLAPIYLMTLAAFSSQDDVYAYPKELLPRNLSTETMSFFIHFGGVLDALQRSVVVAADHARALARDRDARGLRARPLRVPRRGHAAALRRRPTRAFPIVILSIPLAVIFIRWGIDDTASRRLDRAHGAWRFRSSC